MTSPKRQPRTARTILNELIERVNSDTQRLRIIEQSSESLTSRVEALEQSVLQQRRDVQRLLTELSSKISVLEAGISKSDSTLKEVIGHMKKLVTETRLKELETLIEIYNPLKSSFVTKEELEKILGNNVIRKPKKQ